jgi:tRNA A-37 threonylcarbamoyl transferase component Bud32
MAITSIRIGPERVWLTSAVTPDMAVAALADLPTDFGRHHVRRCLGEIDAFVKVYNRRQKHGLIRRLRSARSMREAAGYLAFAQAGLAAPDLLLWSELRRFGLLERGVIVTAWVASPTVAEALVSGEDHSLLSVTAAALARIHRAGLAHGDPRTRNFLATPEGPMAFDLCSWGRLTEQSRTWDLTKFLGSSVVLVGDESIAAALLEAYERAAEWRAPEAEALVREAAAYAQREGVA